MKKCKKCFPQWELGTGRILCRDCDTVMTIPAAEAQAIQRARLLAILKKETP